MIVLDDGNNSSRAQNEKKLPLTKDFFSEEAGKWDFGKRERKVRKEKKKKRENGNDEEC